MLIKINHQPIAVVGVRQELIAYTENHVRNEKERNQVVNFLNGKEIKSEKTFQRAFHFVHGILLAAWVNASLATTAMAQELNSTEQQTLDQIDGVLFKIQLICVGICVSVAIIMAMIAGFFRMIGLREEAKKRYMDAIAGMTMVLTAPAVLGVIATIVRGLIKLFPNYAA